MTEQPRGLVGVSAIWLREIRGRMRGKRAFVFLTFYLAVLAGLLWIGLRTTTAVPMGALESVSVGRGIFATIVLIETLVVLILAPAYTGAAISQEREKQTFDLLAATPVSSLTIVVGKLISAMSFLALIVGASIPLASMAFLFGGVGLTDLLVAYLVIAAVAVGAGALGVACSAIFGKTQPATVAAFVAVALVAGASTVSWIAMESRAREPNQPTPPTLLLYPNPFIGMADALCASTGDGCLSIPERRALVDASGAVAPEPNFGRAEPGSVWPKTIVSWLVVAVAAILVAAQSVSPTRRLRLSPLRFRARPRPRTTEP
jgi:ABC-2 type transport system permease protein